MPRPQKARRVCAVPAVKGFAPLGAPAGGGPVALSVDEYEALRLIDLEGLTQEQCAAQMDVARTTVQAVYSAARAKVADALVNGRALVIEGGCYRVCPRAPGCPRRAGGCRRARCAAACPGHEDREQTKGSMNDEQDRSHV